MPNRHVEKVPLISYVCQGKCLHAAWTLPGMPGFFSDLIVKKTKKFNQLRRFWDGLKTKVGQKTPDIAHGQRGKNQKISLM
jgi:hypothetical protein